ncbi:MAG TPA: hypothetical protein VF824_20815 [Thermoanaerobaculia bacterium]|jgi:hypothetical protein
MAEQDNKPAPAGDVTRAEYEKPSILWEEELDVRKTLAVACGKTAGRAGICNAAPTS